MGRMACVLWSTLAAVLLLSASAVEAQQIGDLHLRLGATRAETMATLRASFARDRLVEQSNADGVVVMERIPFGYKMLGSVLFAEGRLDTVTREWTFPDETRLFTSPENTNRELMQGVISALMELEATPRACAVQSGQDKTPRQTSSVVRIDCDGHGVAIILPSDGLIRAMEFWQRR
jgi:hypothetical protein